MIVARARKIERFLSQPFHVAEVFTGSPGKLVSLAGHDQGLQGPRATATTTICPSRPSTWSAPSRKRSPRPRSSPKPPERLKPGLSRPFR